jgi:hypothetical protein
MLIAVNGLAYTDTRGFERVCGGLGYLANRGSAHDQGHGHAALHGNALLANTSPPLLFLLRSCPSWSHLSLCSFFSRFRSFQAPEVIGGKLYDTSADVHSFGILYWELITGKMPYGELQNGWQVTSMTTSDHVHALVLIVIFHSLVPRWPGQ